MDLIVIGGGLAGCEAAWQAAQRGVKVILYEMRPHITTAAHTSADLAELVCSNSMGSNLPDRAAGLIKSEIRLLGSLLLLCAEQNTVPAGGALAVDRHLFARSVTEKIEAHPLITVVREEMSFIPTGPVIVASGPLTSPGLIQAIQNLCGQQHLYFYDAIAPTVYLHSINQDSVYRASRNHPGDQQSGDYLNCPMSLSEYETFVEALLSAERIELKHFEGDLEYGVTAGDHQFFEGCLPVEILASRGRHALAYGPMRPIGLSDPHTGKRAYAVVQLRQDNLAGSLYNMVGFQTNLRSIEQDRVFRLIPGLENVEFARYGQMHRNTYIYSPRLLRPTLQYNQRDDLIFCGQIIGVEGYVGNIATGLLAGWNAVRNIQGKKLLEFPKTTMLGALCHYVTHASAIDFQPMKANFGILPPLEQESLKGRRERAKAYVNRALADLEQFLITID